MLKSTTGMNSFVNEMKYLENCKERIDLVEKQYFLKMI
jgi:hypothetical protein